MAGATLQWQITPGRTPAGQPALQVVLVSGVLLTQFLLTADAAERFAQGLLDEAKQSRTGIILPTGMTPTGG